MLGVLLFLSLGAFVSEEKLTWKQAVLRAFEENTSLKAAYQNVEALVFGHYGSRSNFMPSVSGSLSYSRSHDGETQALSNSTRATTGTLSLSQNVFSGFSDVGRISQAEAQLEMAREDLKLTLAQVSFDLKSSYENIRFADGTSELSKQIFKRREENMRLVTLRYEAGRENKGSLLLSRAYHSQARFESLQSSHRQRISQADLRAVLALDAATSIQLMDEVPLTEPEQNPSYGEIIEMNPEYQKAMARERSAEAALTIANAPFFPNLDLQGSAGRTWPESGGARGFWSMGLTLSYTFFAGFRDISQAQTKRSEALQASFFRQTLRRQLHSKLEQSYARYVEAVEKMKVDESFREAAQVRAEIAKNKYNNGLLSFEDWDAIENDLILRQKSYLQSRLERVLAEAAWEQTRGVSVFSHLP